MVRILRIAGNRRTVLASLVSCSVQVRRGATRQTTQSSRGFLLSAGTKRISLIFRRAQRGFLVTRNRETIRILPCVSSSFFPSLNTFYLEEHRPQLRYRLTFNYDAVGATTRVSFPLYHRIRYEIVIENANETLLMRALSFLFATIVAD